MSRSPVIAAPPESVAALVTASVPPTVTFDENVPVEEVAEAPSLIRG